MGVRGQHRRARRRYRTLAMSDHRMLCGGFFLLERRARRRQRLRPHQAAGGALSPVDHWVRIMYIESLGNALKRYRDRPAG